MPQFYYACLDATGKKTKGQIDAPSRQAAVARLRADGLAPYEVALAASGAEKTETPFWRRKIELRGRVPKSAVAAFARQLATLLRAGLPLDRALYAIYSGDGESRMGSVVASLRETILGGKDLAEGLAGFPAIFSASFVAMTRAGEASGALDLVMERLAAHLEDEVVARAKIRSALAYPVLMIIVGIAVVVFLLSFVIPQVATIFADMGRELPLPTRILLGASDGFRRFWPLFALLVALLGFGIWRAVKSEKGRRFLQTRVFALPLVGEVYAKTQLGNFARGLGMLLKNGAPLLKALDIARAASANVLVNDAVARMIDGAQAGRELSSFMDEERIFTPVARQMVAAGEKSGRLADMLLWVATDAENQAQTRLRTLTSLLEPIMILILGCLVGFVVIAIILPIFEMSSLAG